MTGGFDGTGATLLFCGVAQQCLQRSVLSENLHHGGHAKHSSTLRKSGSRRDAETTPRCAPNYVMMIAANRSRIVQAVRLIEHEMKRLWLEMRADGTAEKPVQLREIRVLRTGGIRENQNGMTTFFGKRVVVNFPLLHRACCRHSAAPVRFASSTSSAS